MYRKVSTKLQIKDSLTQSKDNYLLLEKFQCRLEKQERECLLHQEKNDYEYGLYDDDF